MTGAGYGEDVSEDATPPASGEQEPTLAYPEPRPMPYGSSPYAVTVDPAAVMVADVPQRRLVEPADVWTAVLGTLAVSLVGVLAGFVWLWVAPRAAAVADGKGHSGIVDPSTKAFAGADVAFLGIGLAAGVLCAVVAAILARHRGLAVTVAMAVGGTAASFLATWLGRTISGGPVGHWQNHIGAGNHRYFLELGNEQFLLAWPIVALIVTFIVALVTPDRPVAVEISEPAPSPPDVSPAGPSSPEASGFTDKR
jgi:hypothetical protein